MSDPASKKPRRESETDTELQMLAASARQQRERIRLEIEKLDRLPVLSPKDVVSSPKGVVSSSKDVVPCPNYVLQLSNPTFDTKLPFPFVGQTVPDRFQVNGKDDERNWFYMGREKFAELSEEFERTRDNCQRPALIIYGTRGYGKSHLLAALVCCLAAREEKVVYIPDCREFVKQPVPYIRAAILFAWADDKSKQQRIMALDTLEEIDWFFQGQNDVIFVIDQTNALEEEEGDDVPTINKKAQLYYWLEGIQVTGKAILGSSTNNHSILNEPLRRSNEKTMYVYGGLTEVGLRSNNSFI
jgi:Cdc6-like AAA superfamily ATPase